MTSHTLRAPRTLFDLFRDGMAAEADGIVQGFGVVQPAEAFAESLRVVKGRARGEAVSAHLAAQADSLTRRCEAASNYGRNWVPFAADMQAGAASARCMAECLDALMDGDVALFKATVEQFVNDAVTSGAVTVTR
jgi:hypothetical protein